MERLDRQAGCAVGDKGLRIYLPQKKTARSGTVGPLGRTGRWRSSPGGRLFAATWEELEVTFDRGKQPPHTKMLMEYVRRQAPNNCRYRTQKTALEQGS